MKVGSLDLGHSIFRVGNEQQAEMGVTVHESVADATTRIGLRARATLSPVAHTMWLRYGG